VVAILPKGQKDRQRARRFLQLCECAYETSAYQDVFALWCNAI